MQSQASLFALALVLACGPKSASTDPPASTATACMEDGALVAPGSADSAHAQELRALATASYDAPLAWSCQGAGCAVPPDAAVHMELRPTGEPCAILDCSGQPDAVASRPRAERARACAKALAIDTRVSVRTSDAWVDQSMTARLVSGKPGEGQLEAVLADAHALRAKLHAEPSDRAQLTVSLRNAYGVQQGMLRVAIENPSPAGAENVARGAWEARWQRTSASDAP